MNPNDYTVAEAEKLLNSARDIGENICNNVKTYLDVGDESNHWAKPSPPPTFIRLTEAELWCLKTYLKHMVAFTEDADFRAITLYGVAVGPENPNGTDMYGGGW